jgi:hypothetical protein
MSLPTPVIPSGLPNQILGTRLFDILGQGVGGNEVATFGTSNINPVKIRFYDSNIPSSGAVLTYGSCNFIFTRDTGSLNVGINTNIARSAFTVVGDCTFSSTVTTKNLVVIGGVTVPVTVTSSMTSAISLYNSSGNSYKNVVTNDTISDNCILMSFSVNGGRYIFTTTLTYTNLDPSFTPSTNVVQVGLYPLLPSQFIRSVSIPSQSASLFVTSGTNAMSTTLTFLLDVNQTTNYIIAVNGVGQQLQFRASGTIVPVGGYSTGDTSDLRQTLQITPVRQSFYLTSPCNVFSLTTNGIYQVNSSNAEIYRNGIKLAYYSPQSNDYSVYYNNTSTTTTFTVVTSSNLAINDLLDVSIWPLTQSTTFTNSYLYQLVNNNYVGTNGLNINPNNGYVGIGTFNATQPLSVVGQSYFSSNLGIGTSYPSSTLTIYNSTTNTASLSIQQSLVGQEFPPTSITNYYLAPDYTDTISSIDFSPSLSNLEYPPAAMTNSTSYLLSTYGAGTYTASCSTSNNASYPPWYAFDKTSAGAGVSIWKSDTAYSSSGDYSGGPLGSNVTYDTNNTGYAGEWLQLQVPFAVPLEKYSINVRSDSTIYNPSTWYILGSLDGLNWKLLDTRTTLTFATNETRTFDIRPSLVTLSSYFRLVTQLIQGSGLSVHIGEWRLFTNVSIPRNIYPKYKASIPNYTTSTTYGLGQYQIWANSMYNYSFSNQTLPSGLFTKTIGTNSNTVWISYSNSYTSSSDAPSQYVPIIYTQFPDLIQLSSYSLTVRGGNMSETPSKWTLFGSNAYINSAWQTIDSQSSITNWVPFQTFNYSTASIQNAYNVYRLELYRNNSSNSSTNLSLAELRFYGKEQTTDSRLIVASSGVIGIGTFSPQATVEINGDLSVTGNLCHPLMRTGPNVIFDGSTTNRDLFLKWMQYVTSKEYRYALNPRTLASGTWWNTNNDATLYDNYVYSTVTAALPGAQTYAYVGGVLLPDGRVVFVPYGATTIGVFNPSTNLYTTILADSGYYGGVLLSDGRVVFVPWNVTRVGIFNPTTNTYTTVLGMPGTSYSGGVLLPDGRVVFVPYATSTIVIFNPITNTFATVLGVAGGCNNRGGILLPDGRVIFVSTGSGGIGIFNSLTNTYTTIAGGSSYEGGVLFPDGRVGFIPVSNGQFGIFNPFTNTFTTIAITDGYRGGVLLPDGRVILVPTTATTIGIFNPTTNTYSTIVGEAAANGGTYAGGVLLPDGRIVCVPHCAAVIGIITPTQIPRPPPLELCYHPCFNKY